MNVFVIVVAYNGAQWYDRCFSSLRQSSMPVHVVVVDNASPDGVKEMVREKFPEIHLIESDKNLGFGKANNQGIRYALEQGADYVLLLNQDAWIEPDALGKLVEIHQEHPEYGILSPIHLAVDKQQIEPLLLERIADGKTTDPKMLEDLYFGTVKEVYETQYVNAAAWLLPRKTLETVGGFDPFFFMYGEDDNYINRVHYHGLKIGLCPKARVVHDARTERPLYDSREHEVLMMIDYTDVNKNHVVRREMRQHCLKAVTGFLRGRRQASQNHYADYLWLKANRNAIEQSVATNRKVGPNWL